MFVLFEKKEKTKKKHSTDRRKNGNFQLKLRIVSISTKQKIIGKRKEKNN